MTMSHNIANWLATMPHVSAIDPCTVTIKGKVYPAAKYVTTTPLDSSCRAYAEGKRESVQTMIYCAGAYPRCAANRKVAFAMYGAPHEFYIAGYWPALDHGKQASVDACKPKHAAYHPFGANFMLAPWDCGGTIDQYERVPYRRVALDIRSTAEEETAA